MLHGSQALGLGESTQVIYMLITSFNTRFLPRSKSGLVLQKKSWVTSPGANGKVNLKSHITQYCAAATTTVQPPPHHISPGDPQKNQNACKEGMVKRKGNWYTHNT